MPSPFPGMDPYLEEEALWPHFQHQLVLAFYQTLVPGLADRYRARVSRRTYVTEQVLFTSILRIEHQEDFIEIRQRSNGRLITLVDMVSPSNKTTGPGRSAFLEKRLEGRNAKANLVEIDLVLQGQPILDYARDGLPQWDYAVTVTKSAQPDRHEIYTATLQNRLPGFKLPLAVDDREAVVDLQAVFNRCYEEGRFRTKIDYERDPAVPLKPQNLRWMEDLLSKTKLRDKG